MIVGKRIKLRAIEYEDLPLIIKWRNDPDIYQYFYEYEPLSLVSQRKWFENFLQKKDEKLWIIESIADNEAIGTLGLARIDWRNRKAEWGRIFIYPEKYRRKGYGAEAISLLLQYSFDHINLNRLCCDAFANNERVISLYKEFGFKEEGLFRQYIFKNGQYRDVVYLALLKEEYLNHSKEVIKKYLGA
ncbi:MAG: UDP-4-amino-4,6-dideoxy-N-acetyl-beta-L-altrosamine N-acetyltransferase [Syntrophales bacterium]|jgi:UDP-4-amino-4,6-dideoxy-N-acetyl-beta-L-altrosamine N-acetyltransferase